MQQMQKLREVGSGDWIRVYAGLVLGEELGHWGLYLVPYEISENLVPDFPPEKLTFSPVARTALKRGLGRWPTLQTTRLGQWLIEAVAQRVAEVTAWLDKP